MADQQQHPITLAQSLIGAIPMTDYKQLCAELVAWAEKTSAHYYSEPEVLIRARAALAEPEPEGPTDEELLEAVKAGVVSFPPRHPEALNLSVVEYQVELEIRKARAVLARWGRPAPIPVTERLPEPEDCDAEDGVGGSISEQTQITIS